MTKSLTQLLPECEVKSQHFCGSCRQMSRGRAFRETILSIREIEGVDADFDCPKGRPWVADGLGDTIAKATKAVGIKPCGGCKKRQAALNKLVPYKKSP